MIHSSTRLTAPSPTNQTAIDSSRTEAEMAQWYSCIAASEAQTRVFEIYPELKQMAQGAK